MMTYFQPVRGQIYFLKCDTTANQTGYYYLWRNASDGKIHGDTSVHMGPDNYDSLWQLMPVGTNSFIIVSQANGKVAKVMDTDGYHYLGLANVDDETPTITGIVVGDKVALYIPASDAYLFPENAANFLRVEAKSSPEAAAVWSLEAPVASEFESSDMDDQNYTVPALPEPKTANQPVFDDNGNAPLFTGKTLAKATYVPYCLVNDPTLSPAQAVLESPYYLLQQYEQYHQAACVDNNTDGEHIFVEHWQYGASESKSRSFTQQFGLELGFNLEENEFIVKETENAKASGELGFQEGNTTSGTVTGSKEIRVQVPARSSVALYGISTSYKLFRMEDIQGVSDAEDVQCIKEIDKFSRMASRFLTISSEIGS